MKNVIITSIILGSAFAAFPAFADKASYCAAYARDFADQSTADKTMWQHKYQISLDACLAKHSKPAKAPLVFKPKTKNLEPAAPAPKPVVAAPVVAAPVAKPKPAVLIAGSPDWNDYCSKKYVSFNAKTGTYTSKTGVERRCVVSK